MRKLVNFCDYFVICSGNTSRQVKAIANHIDDELAAAGLSIKFKQGLKSSDWIVFDAGDVVTHIFEKDMQLTIEFPVTVTKQMVDKLIRKDDAGGGGCLNMYL